MRDEMFYDVHTLTWHYYPKSVYLHDNNEYYLDDYCVVETVVDAQHGDLTTVIAKDIRPIPKGTQLKVRKVWRNFYGLWVEVFYDGRHYDLHPRDLKYVKRESDI